MVRLVARSPFALACAAAAFLTGCFDTSSTITTASYPTVLTVDPALFRGTVSCGSPGLALYVATLIDVSFLPTMVLAPSAPTRCQNPVSFGPPAVGSDAGIAINHSYIAAIEGYDRDDIEPDPADGRKMVDRFSRQPVLPAWTTTCGEDTTETPAADADVPEGGYPPGNPLRAPTRALGNIEVIVSGCLPLVGATTPDASVDDAASPPADASIEADLPADASIEASDPGSPEGGDSDADDGASGESDGG